MDLESYLAAARRESRIRSDAQLARELGVTRQSLAQWRLGIAAPRLETMLKLAALAHQPPEVALVDHMAWRADGPKSRDIVARIRASIAATAAAILLFFVFFPPSPLADTCDTDRPCSVYYGNGGLWKSLLIELVKAKLR